MVRTDYDWETTMSRHERHDPAGPEERELAQALVVELSEAPTKRADRDLRHQIRSLVVTCLRAGQVLNLSDESEPLGHLMALANARARQMGWL